MEDYLVGISIMEKKTVVRAGEMFLKGELRWI